MAWQGDLKDLSVLDILQVVAFSKKTGSLHVEGLRARGAIVFQDGIIVCAYSTSTLDLLRSIQDSEPDTDSAGLVREQIHLCLRELSGLKEGTFRFHPNERSLPNVEGLDLDRIPMGQGINPLHLLLELAKEMDEERRDARALFEALVDHPTSASASPSEPLVGDESARAPSPLADRDPSVVLVDDELPVTGILGNALRRAGYCVFTAPGPAEGASLIEELTASGHRLLLVTDLRMPTTTGRSFFGGFELVRTVRRRNWRVPVILMTEKLTPKVRARAKRLGIRKVAFKPALSKLDPEQYKSDLHAFATVVAQQLSELEKPGAAAAPDRVLPGLGFLKSMTEQLLNPESVSAVSRIVLHVASRYLERSILFLLKDNTARALGAFGITAGKESSSAPAQTLALDIHQVQPFAEVVHTRMTYRMKGDLEALEGLFAALGRGRAKECVLLPLINNREVLAILYGDNPFSGRALGKLRGLELVLAQAGTALENVFLQRKLRFFESKLRPRKQEVPQG
ncbi:MAG: response regulator [Acidobacteriota bacterium]